MRITRKLKTALYQKLILDTELINYYTSEVEDYSGNIDDYIAESGLELQPRDIKYPAVRFKILDNLPTEPCRNCDDKRKILFDIYFESRQMNSDEIDDLMDITRDIYTEDCGRALGLFTETSTYALIAGSGEELDVWDIEEIAYNKYKAVDEPRIIRQESKESGVNYLGFIRFQMIAGSNRL
jgi:hypothetical protein